MRASGMKVLMCDLAYIRWSDKLFLLLKTVSVFATNITIQRNFQKQQGGHEYGLYVIANATS